MAKLQQCVDAWEKIGAPRYVLDWIREGVTIPLTGDIEPFEIPNHNLPEKHKQFVDAEIQRLLSCGYIEPCASKPVCVSPIGVVPKKNNKLRLITDLRKLNGFCDVPKYRNEDIRDTVKIIDYVVLHTISTKPLDL